MDVLSKKMILPVVLSATFSQHAFADENDFIFITNWYAQAEHGGFYQAQAEELYKKNNLNVQIKMGGPQVNGTQILVAGKADCMLTEDINVIRAVQRGLPIEIVATTFQYDPTVIITHKDIDDIQQLKDKTLLVSASAHSSWWPWIKNKYQFSDDMTRPYTFNIQPFVINKSIAQQGFLTSEPYALVQENVDINVFSIGEMGYPPYGNSIACHTDSIKKKPQQITAFLKATMQGWKDYLDNPAPANALIRKENPNMSAGQLSYSVNKLKDSKIITGGDAQNMGIGVITEKRMQATLNMSLENGLLEEDKPLSAPFYTMQFMKDIKVMP